MHLINHYAQNAILTRAIKLSNLLYMNKDKLKVKQQDIYSKLFELKKNIEKIQEHNNKLEYLDLLTGKFNR